MLPWLARVARHCNRRDHESGTRTLAQLGRRSFELMEQFADDGVQFDLQRRGLVVAAQEPAAAQRFLDGLEPLRALGFRIPERVLQTDELHELEPTLGDAVQAGFLVEEHWHVLPASFMRGLTARLRDMDVRIEEGAEVLELAGDGDRVRELRTAAGSFGADAVVLAAGSWSPALARGRRLRLPVEAGKGYSFELWPHTVPRHALLLLEPHVGCSPHGDRLRIAGTMEFSGVNRRIDERRVASIMRGVRSMLRDLGSGGPENVWSGMRPIAPDGLPIIDRAPRHENLYLATAVLDAWHDDRRAGRLLPRADDPHRSPPAGARGVPGFAIRRRRRVDAA